MDTPSLNHSSFFFTRRISDDCCDFFLVTLDELERNVFLKIQTKIRMELELEEEARIVMWRWPMSTLTEKVMHQNLESKLEQVD
jgi:hypothetical protein